MAYAFGRNLLLSSVGFERLIDAFEQLESTESGGRAQAYPPYNIVKLNEHDYTIEVAVAGFTQDEIDITAEGNKLSIIGKVKQTSPGQFLHKGIATRDFTHHFTLAETVVVRSADMVNGLLVVKLENVIPEEKLPRKIMIGGSSAKLVVDERQAA
jgi:molecular chaperone IbpA